MSKLKKALGVDQVLSLHQVERYFQLKLTAENDQGLHVEHVYMSPVSTNVFESQMVGLVTLNPRLSFQLTADQLAHMMGTAEVRLSLGIPLAEWQPNAQALGQKLQPDALWKKSEGEIWAVEYDSGAYKPQVVAQKMEVFSKKYQGILWGTVGDLRLRKLQRHYGAQARITTLRWWGPERGV